jgi:flagellar M-ring protein FliF
VLTLKSLEFQEIQLPPGTEATSKPSAFLRTDRCMSMIQTAVLAIVALVLGLFVVRPVLTSANRAALPAPDTQLALAPGHDRRQRWP